MAVLHSLLLLTISSMMVNGNGARQSKPDTQSVELQKQIVVKLNGFGIFWSQCAEEKAVSVLNFVFHTEDLYNSAFSTYSFHREISQRNQYNNVREDNIK